jgi:hypothetical protein
MRSSGFGAKLGLFAVATAFTGVFFINWCNLIYQCGCTFLWAGAGAHCNVHAPQPPHCPFCVNTAAAGAAFGLTLMAQGAVSLWPGPLTRLRAIAAFVASPVVVTTAGAVLGLASGYWSG